jgi:hypothetical protein
MITPKIVFDDGLGPVRTNLFTRSQDLTDASWTKPANFSVTGDTTIAPDGTVTMDTVTDNEAAASSSVAKNIGIPNDSATYTFSFFIKPGTGAVTAIKVALTNGATPVNAWLAINPTTGQFSKFNLGTAPAAVQVTALANGCWRFAWQITNNSSGNNSMGISIRPAAAAALAGNGLSFTTNEDITLLGTNIVWGFQVEVGSVATDYIPTVAAAATSTQTTLIPTYPPMDKLGADELNSIRHDSITTSGVKQSIAERTETFINLNFKWVPASDIPVWQQFMTWALAGGIFTYYPDNTVPQFPVAKQYTLEDDNWQPKRVAVGHYSFQLRGRLWVP